MAGSDLDDVHGLRRIRIRPGQRVDERKRARFGGRLRHGNTATRAESKGWVGGARPGQRVPAEPVLEEAEDGPRVAARDERVRGDEVGHDGVCPGAHTQLLVERLLRAERRGPGEAVGAAGEAIQTKGASERARTRRTWSRQMTLSRSGTPSSRRTTRRGSVPGSDASSSANVAAVAIASGEGEKVDGEDGKRPCESRARCKLGRAPLNDGVCVRDSLSQEGRYWGGAERATRGGELERRRGKGTGANESAPPSTHAHRPTPTRGPAPPRFCLQFFSQAPPTSHPSQIPCVLEDAAFASARPRGRPHPHRV